MEWRFCDSSAGGVKMGEMARYSIGLDFGTNSARCIVVRLDDGVEVGHATCAYPSGEDGILLSDKEPELARQQPSDYLYAAERIIRDALPEDLDAREIVGIGVDATASTPIPLGEGGEILHSDNLAAKAWLWKDHTSFAEAAEITELAKKQRPQYLAKCGGAYSSEWFWAKLLRCARTAPDVFRQTSTWLECADFVPAALTGTLAEPKRGICAAGHKGMFHTAWGGYPDKSFLTKLHPALTEIELPSITHTCAERAGGLTKQWAGKTGLNEGTPVAIGGIDAHLGAVGSGIKQGTLVKILGTSSCDMAVWPLDADLPDIPGISGIVPQSILPGMYGLEAGQAAVGDLFNWFASTFEAGEHHDLSKEAAELKPGQSGLLALDWNNGNRSTLADPRLSGLLLGQTLRTKPHEVYRALIEASAFGALTILDRFEEYGVRAQEIIVCGGIVEKSPLILQIYADVTGRTLKVSAAAETCALGSAVCGAVAGGAFPDFESAQKRITRLRTETYSPCREAHATYSRLYKLYRQLQNSFARAENRNVMKELLQIRDSALA